MRVLAVLHVEDCGLDLREVSAEEVLYLILNIPAESLQHLIEERPVLLYSGIVVLLDFDSQLFLHERAHIVLGAVGGLFDQLLYLYRVRASGHILLLQVLSEPLDHRSLGCFGDLSRCL